MIGLSVTWIDSPVGTISHEKRPFRWIKKLSAENSDPKQ
jgi:hypothetical protein